MPLYEYQCDACGQRFEIIQKFSDAPPDTCRLCGKGPVQRLLSSPAIQFKGSGWYITDYSQKGKPPAESSSGATSEKKESGKSGTTTSTASETAKPSTESSSAKTDASS